MNIQPKRAKCTDCQEFCYPKKCCMCNSYLCKKCEYHLNNKIYCKGCYVDKLEMSDKIEV
jgi:hypothetical protein